MENKAELKLKCLEFIINNPKIVNTQGSMDIVLKLTDNLYKFLTEKKDDNVSI